MSSQLTSSPLFIAALIFGLLGVVLIFAGITSLPRIGLLRFTYRTLIGLLLLALGGLAGTISLGMQGYQALTREDVAARISVAPTGPQHFLATFQYPDGHTASFAIAGDDIYVDARILKWKPWVRPTAATALR